MRSDVDISATAADRRPFSNGTEGYGWMGAWCDDCVHNDEETELWCPILTVAILGKTPMEWRDGPRDEQGHYGIADQYECSEFEERPDGDGPGDDEPEPPQGPGPFEEEMPGQTDIFTFIVEDALENMPVAEAVSA